MAKAQVAATETVVNTDESAKPAFAPKVKKRVTLQLFKIEKKKPYYFRMESAMAIGKAVANSQMEPATVVQVTNLVTGEIGQIICPSVLKKELSDAYPDDSYVGKCFELSIHPVAGKRYSVPQITEIEDPTA